MEKTFDLNSTIREVLNASQGDCIPIGSPENPDAYFISADRLGLIQNQLAFFRNISTGLSRFLELIQRPDQIARANDVLQALGTNEIVSKELKFHPDVSITLSRLEPVEAERTIREFLEYLAGEIPSTWKALTGNLFQYRQENFSILFGRLNESIVILDLACGLEPLAKIENSEYFKELGLGIIEGDWV